MERDEKQKFCYNCGSRIPLNANFCPYCGAIQEEKIVPQPAVSKEKLVQTFVWEKGFYIRMVMLILSLMIFLIFFFIGSQTNLTPNEAGALIESYEEAVGRNPTATYIASRNLFICLLLFTPLLGPFLLAFISHNTGLIASAIALQSSSLTSIEVFQSILLYPWTWMEISAYSLASAQSVMLLLGALTHNLRREARSLLISILICIILLVSASMLEAAFIGQ